MNIMHTTKRHHALLRISLLALFGLLILFTQSRSACAQWATNGNNINNTNTGNVGIATTSPGTTLDVSGNTLTLGSDTGATTRTNNATKLNRLAMPAFTSSNLKFSVIAGATTSTDNMVGVGGGAGGFAASTLIFFNTAATTNTDTGTERMRITSTGNVGIGTTGPTYRLQVSGNGGTAGDSVLVTDSNTTTTAVDIANTSSGGKKWRLQSVGSGISGRVGNFELVQIESDLKTLVVQPGGNVGIGTTSPRGLLDVAGDGKVITVGVNSTFGAGLVLSGSAGTALLSNNAFITAGAANFSNVDISKSSAIIEFANQDTYFRRVGSGSTPSVTESMFIQGSTGNVGIATLTPAEKLHVVGNGRFTGNLTVDGNIAAKYQDVAEWVPATRPLPTGTVVTLNPTQSNLVEASSKAYDTRVAGVISAQPGITLGERGENRVLVATTGRVKVKAVATNAPINIGDLLVTSDTSGMAMKSEPITIGGRQIHSPGTLIGKALEPLAKGQQGEILVLLSLQ